MTRSRFANTTMDDLQADIKRIETGDKPPALATPGTYADALRRAVAVMPRMSSRQIAHLMEALHCAYQLGQINSRQNGKQ